LERLGRPISEIQEAVHAAGKHEAFELGKRVDLLATIAAVAPMLGFLGTVTGMIKAFKEIQSLQGNGLKPKKRTPTPSYARRTPATPCAFCSTVGLSESTRQSYRC
jgi:hypothetical protein